MQRTLLTLALSSQLKPPRHGNLRFPSNVHILTIPMKHISYTALLCNKEKFSSRDKSYCTCNYKMYYITLPKNCTQFCLICFNYFTYVAAYSQLFKTKRIYSFKVSFICYIIGLVLDIHCTVLPISEYHRKNDTYLQLVFGKYLETCP